MHIVLLILKIIGIVLLCLIGLVLLVLAALLFAAFHYEISAEGDKDGPSAHADVRVRWLLRIVSLRLEYNLPNQTEYVLRVFGIPVKKSAEKTEEKKDGTSDGESGEKKDEGADGKAEGDADSKTEDKTDGKDKKEAKAESVSADPSVSVEAKEETAEEGKAEGEKSEEEKSEEEKSEGEQLPEEPSEAPEGEKKGKIRQKIDALKEKASSLLDSLEAMLVLFGKKKGLLEKYLTKKSTQKALRTAWKNVWWILRHICPKKYHGDVEFGMDDPALTGDICAAIAPWYPIVSDYLKLTPNFDPALCAQGDIYLKGRIRLWGILIRAWRVYRDKNIRKVIREAEKVKEKITKTPDEVKEIFGKAA